jgi:predicted RNA-binding Zn-ribbon protein involved in translation (DUF1610 family)
MASQLLCVCGNLLQLTLHEGNGLQFLVQEEITELPTDETTPCGALLDMIVRESAVVALCPQCGVLSIVDQDLNVRQYAPVQG